VQELVNTGHISEEEARTHPRRNIVTRALGIEPTVRVDTWLVPMVHGDRFILCSDGLVDEVHDDDIAEIAITITDPQLCAEQLILKANANGGRDNVTVVVVDVLQGVEPTASDAELESEPGWDGSESSSTMIDADANSVPTLAGVIAVQGAPVPPVVVVGGSPEPPKTSNSWGTGRFLKWLGAAAGLVIVAALIAALVYNNVHDDPAPTTTTVAVTEPATTPDTVPATTSARTSGTTTTIVGTTTSGP
jgi:hypothetical protein